MSSGCGCKELYIFPHITYPYSFCICYFLQHPSFFIFLCFSFFIDYIIKLIPIPLVSVLFCSSIPTFCSFFNFNFYIFYTL